MSTLKTLVQKRKTNSGFTLVELIIVIAIILVLIAVLAPQYTQYVERTRESNDLQVSTAMLDALTVIVADPKNEIPQNLRFLVTWGTSGNDAITTNALYATGGSVPDPLGAQYEETLLQELAKILGATYSVASNGVSQISGVTPESEVAKHQSLIFYLYTNTGTMRLYNDAAYDGSWSWSASGDWINEIGLDIDRP